MKNLYKTFAIAAVAAVSMFSAQSANAQYIRNVPTASVVLGMMDEDEPELTSSDPFNDYLKGVFERTLALFKKKAETGYKFTKEEIKTMVDAGQYHGYTEESIRAYLGQPAE